MLLWKNVVTTQQDKSKKSFYLRFPNIETICDMSSVDEHTNLFDLYTGPRLQNRKINDEAQLVTFQLKEEMTPPWCRCFTNIPYI